MTDTSAVTKGAEKAPEQKTVPVPAIGEARAQKRAAQEDAANARTELAKVVETQLTPDDIAKIADAVAEEARKRVDAEIAPYKARAQKAELAVQLGLNNEQVDKVMEVKLANPNLTEQQALLLAKSENGDLFAPRQAGWNRALHSGLPTSGSSDSRAQPAAPDFMAKIEEAKAKGDKAAVMYYAKQEVLQRFRDQFLKSRPL